MNVNNISLNNKSFKGYDVVPLRGLYMQGTHLPKALFDEMSTVAKKEKVELFVNQSDVISNKWHEVKDILKGDVWGQDTAAFVGDNGLKTILWNIRKYFLRSTGVLSDYLISPMQNLPRGGNYYIGYNKNGEKWMLISEKSIKKENLPETSQTNYIPGLYNKNEIVNKETIYKVFNVKPENLYIIDTSTHDMDMLVRPIGYPYVLVNSNEETLKNIIKLKEKYKNREDIAKLCDKMSKFCESSISDSITEKIKNDLRKNGFIPIDVGGWYNKDINFMNALAFKNDKNKIAYITNSTKDSIKGIEYLEELFINDLKAKVQDIDKVYFISGGKADISNIGSRNSKIEPYNTSVINRNHIMNMLGYYGGGIHCMTAEIPDFDRIM